MRRRHSARRTRPDDGQARRYGAKTPRVIENTNVCVRGMDRLHVALC